MIQLEASAVARCGTTGLECCRETLDRANNADISEGSIHNTSRLDSCVHTCRPLHHNANALRNVSYMVDDAELPDILANLPPCDGASDEGECIWRASPGSALTSHIVLEASAWDVGMSCAST